MKSRFTMVKVILLFLLVTGFSFPQYYSGKVFEQKNFLVARTFSETLKQNLDGKESAIQRCDTLQNEFQQELCRLKYFREKGSLNELINEGNRIEQKFGTSGGESYGKLFLEFLSILTSSRYRSTDDIALHLSQGYAVQAFKKSNTFDLETEWRLLMYLRYSLSEIELNDTQIQERRERVRLWLHALHRLEVEKDENFDPDDVPSLNVAPPTGVRVGFAGMSPEAIKDPKLRAEYEAAIEANAKKAEYRAGQFRLRQNENFIVKNAVKYISKVYSISPKNLGELQELLNDSRVSDDLKREIETKIQLLATEFGSSS
ncbi:MAG: hypothetical protein WBD22_02940 [Pyrinomonadaceae bacterium]